MVFKPTRAAASATMRAFGGSPHENERGVTAIEYGLIAGLVSIAIIGALTLLGTNLADIFNRIATAVHT